MSSPAKRGGGKKRGHQHHPRNEGNRKSALEKHSCPPLSVFSTENAVTVRTSTTTTNELQSPPTSASRAPKSAETSCNSPKRDCDTIEVIDLTNCDDEISSSSNGSVKEALTKSVKDDRNNKIRKPKSKPNNSRKRNEDGREMCLVHRPAAEGSSQSDLEDNLDPEIEELSKLRCTSERTEVVAERETRRRGRRCADYPGLAFGSIFSSDTLMKFSIIRNELHNIMNTQLKRVNCE